LGDRASQHDWKPAGRIRDGRHPPVRSAPRGPETFQRARRVEARSTNRPGEDTQPLAVGIRSSRPPVGQPAGPTLGGSASNAGPTPAGSSPRPPGPRPSIRGGCGRSHQRRSRLSYPVPRARGPAASTTAGSGGAGCQLKFAELGRGERARTRSSGSTGSSPGGPTSWASSPTLTRSSASPWRSTAPSAPRSRVKAVELLHRALAESHFESQLGPDSSGQDLCKRPKPADLSVRVAPAVGLENSRKASTRIRAQNRPRKAD
jgi:hypothetical protein